MLWCHSATRKEGGPIDFATQASHGTTSRVSDKDSLRFFQMMISNKGSVISFWRTSRRQRRKFRMISRFGTRLQNGLSTKYCMLSLNALMLFCFSRQLQMVKDHAPEGGSGGGRPELGSAGRLHQRGCEETSGEAATWNRDRLVERAGPRLLPFRYL